MIIKLSQYYILKAYPDSFNSDNYDIIKCQRCGCHAIALNIHALEDDFTRKYGYILKPKSLLEPIIANYNKIFFCFLEMKRISCFYLLKLIDTSEENLNDKGKLTMVIYQLSSEEDDNIPHKKKIN